MFRLLGTTSIIGLGAAAMIGTQVQAATEHQDNVLGTSLDITVHGVAPKAAQQATDAAIREIKRLEAHFSPKSADSELSALNSAQAGYKVSGEMLTLLQTCEDWRKKTANALSCRIGSLEAEWQKANQTGTLPDKEYMKRLAKDLQAETLRLDDNEIEKANLKLNPTGIAKGYILDKALATARAVAPAATGIKIDIGGDAVYWGQAGDKESWTVGVANPHAPRDNGQFLASIAVKSKAIATSGHTSRTIRVADDSYSQIINPRTGWAMKEAPAATVVADDAVTADALATALSTMPIKEGLKLVNGMEGVEALIVAADKRLFPSNGWYALEVEAGTATETAWKEGYNFHIDFTIPEINEGNYKRPYVGIWITTPKKKLVKSLMLLGETRRWMEENYVFWRRYGRKYDSIVDGVTRPTRMPGQYQITWDGRDDFGNAVPDGDYLLHVEVSREHGDHTYKRYPITIGEDGFKLIKQQEGEIGGLRVLYGETEKARQG